MSRITTLLLVLTLYALPGVALAESPVSVTATPPVIAIGALYNGMNIQVSGKVPTGAQVIVRVAGEPTTFHMKEKGKVLGVLWMNRDKVAFENAPKVFLVAASSGVSADEAAKHGVPGLAERIKVEPADGDKAALVAEFLTFQKIEKLYLENAGSVTLGQAEGEETAFTANLRMPSRLSPGAYNLEVLAVKDGAVAARGETALEAKFVGAPAFLADMAFGHGTLYGILASVIAILGGIVIGQIFSGSKSGAH